MSSTIGYTPGNLSAAVAAAQESQTHRGGNKYFSRQVTDTTPVSRTAYQCQRDNLQMEREWVHLLPGRVEWVSGLNVGVNPTWYRKSDETDVLYAGTAALAITAASTRYVYIDHADNTAKEAAAWPGTKSAFTPLAIVTTSATAVTEIVDATNLTRLQAHASSTSPTGTTGTTFTLDSDNAGAGADQDLRFNRGSSDAEDAALRWNESDARFDLLTQDTTGTLAPVNCDEVQVAGTTALDADGAAKVQAAVAGDGLTHSSGVLAVNVDDSTIEIATDTVQVKDAGVTAAKLADAVADKLPQVSIPDASGASPQTVRVQMKDRQGNDLDEVCYVEVGVFDDADGAAFAANATIAVGGSAGSLVRTVTSGKDLIVKTNSSGECDLVVTDGTSETVYLLARATWRSRALDAQDVGTVVIS